MLLICLLGSAFGYFIFGIGGALWVVYALFYFAFNARTTIFPVFAIEAYRVLPPELALLFVVSGFGNIVVQGFLIWRLTRRFGEKPLVSLSLIT